MAISYHKGDLPADVDFGSVVAIDSETTGLHLWRDRLAMADVMIALGPGGNFALACRMDTMRRDAVAMARRLRDMLRRATAFRSTGRHGRA